MHCKNQERDDEIRAKHANGTSRMDLIIEYRLSPARIGQILNPEAAKRYREKRAKKVAE